MINRKKILISDHDALNLDFFDLMLSKLGFAVEKAADGQLVLEKISGDEPPDMLIIDVVLPKVSGWEILRAVKTDPKTMNIPVLLLSEIDDVKEIVEAFELGAYDYIVKPFNFLVVLARIRSALRNNVLISQLGAREKRLILAENLNADLKQNIASLQNETEELIREVSDKFEKDGASFPARFEERAFAVKKLFYNIKKNIEQTGTEWRSLKSKEIGMTILEKPINTVKL
ncbi:MAG: response regulator [Spirochaetaceae bacterium]|jgi:DNA-binding response OmpR family regulator|nr:response regulator [Spirochaetaceae bacterium]